MQIAIIDYSIGNVQSIINALLHTRNDIKVDLKQNNLILTAKNDSRERNKTVTLPQDIDGDKISASLKNGVLNITIPKKVKGDCKRIKVT